MLKKGLDEEATKRPSASKLRKNLAKVMSKSAVLKEEANDDEGEQLEDEVQHQSQIEGRPVEVNW